MIRFKIEDTKGNCITSGQASSFFEAFRAIERFIADNNDLIVDMDKITIS